MSKGRPRRETIGARTLPEVIERIAIRALMEGKSPSSFAASILEEWDEANPVDDLTVARYRRAIRERGRATPVDLLVPSNTDDLAASAERTRRDSNPQPLGSKPSALSNWASGAHLLTREAA